jgi:hypothetical protein
MLVIEEYPASKNPHKDTITDVYETLNFDLAVRGCRLAVASLACLGGILEE